MFTSLLTCLTFQFPSHHGDNLPALGMDSQTGSPGLNSQCVVDLLYPCCYLFAASAILDVTKSCSSTNLARKCV